MTTSNSFLRAAVRLVLIMSVIVVAPGCGGDAKSRQREMLENAIRRDNDDDDDEDASPSLQVAKKKRGDEATKETSAEKTPSPQPEEVAKPNHAESTSSEPTSDVATKPRKEPRKPDRALTEIERVKRTISNVDAISAAMEKFVKKTGYYPAQAIYDDAGTPLLSWRVLLLPHLGYDDLYKKFNLKQPWYTPHNKALLAEIPSVYQSPERFDDKTNYLVPFGTSSAFQPPNKSVRRKSGEGTGLRFFEDGVANTAILLEVDDDHAVTWTQPDDFRYDVTDPGKGLGGIRPGGFIAVWGGGLVSWIPERTSKKKILNMFSIDGGENFSFTEVSQPLDLLLSRLTATTTVPLPSTPTPSPALTGSTPTTPTVSSARSKVVAEMREAARTAYAARNESDAFWFYYASALIADKGDLWHEEVRWYPALKRPALTLRWAVSVEYSGPKEIRDPAPIGKNVKFTSARFGQAVTELKKDTGELGLRLLSHLRKQDYGNVGGMSNGMASDPRRIPRTVRNDEDIYFEDPHQPKYIFPGLFSLGRVSCRAAVYLATKGGFDIVAHFKVAVKETEQKETHNTTTLSLFDVETNREIYTTKPLNNMLVERDRDDPLTEDPVIEVFDQLGEFIKGTLRPVDIPRQLKPEHARADVYALS